MGPVTVAHLRHIFLHNLNHSQSLEEVGVSGVFKESLKDLLRCALGSGRLSLEKKKMFETLKYDNIKITSHFYK